MIRLCFTIYGVKEVKAIDPFENIANRYDEWYTSKRGMFIDAIETSLVFKLLPPDRKWHVLDVGCGTGNFTVKLARSVKSVVGVDISESMLEKARKKIRELKLSNATVIRANALHLPFESERFDAVYSVTALEFFESPSEAVKEMKRVAKKGGWILLATINRESPWGRLYIKEGQEGHPVFAHARFYTLEEVISLMPEHYAKSDGCLHIPPNASEEMFCLRIEREYKRPNPPGFIAVLFRVR